MPLTTQTTHTQHTMRSYYATAHPPHIKSGLLIRLIPVYSTIDRQEIQQIPHTLYYGSRCIYGISIYGNVQSKIKFDVEFGSE